jgi:hypothetical protein
MISAEDIADLKKTDEVWLVLIRRVRGYVESNKGKMKRPYLLILYEIAPNTILRSQEVLYDHLGRFPKPEKVYNFLVQTMRETLEQNNNQPPHRPSVVIFTSKRIYSALLKNISEVLRVTPKYWTEEENQGFGDDFVVRYSKKLVEKMSFGESTASNKPGLLTIPDVTPNFVGELFKAGSAFYKTAIWRRLKQNQVFTISWKKETRFFLVTGNNFLESGFMMEANWDEVKSLLSTHKRINTDLRFNALFFVTEIAVPFDDLDAQERYGWEISAPLPPEPKKEEPEKEPTEGAEGDKPAEKKKSEEPENWPLPVTFATLPPDVEDIRRPNAVDLSWMEVATRVITAFANENPTVPDKIIYKQDVIFSASGKATIRYSFCPSPLEWTELEKYIEQEKKRHVAPVCKKCGKIEEEGSPLKICGQCKQKLYCSRECQSADWGSHKLNCRKPQA